MRPITDIRRERLRQMIADVAEGNQSRFGEMIGKSRAYVGFWLTDPAKAHAKQISHEMARSVEAEMRRRGHREYADGWLDHDPDGQSQAAILDADRLGHALTAIDKVIRSRGLLLEGRLGTFKDLLAYAYALQDADDLSPTGTIADELGGMIERGKIEVARKPAPAGVAKSGARKAQGKKAGGRRP